MTKHVTLWNGRYTVLTGSPEGGGYDLSSEEDAMLVEVDRVDEALSTLSPKVSWARALFEFVLPPLIGCYAIFALLTA